MKDPYSLLGRTMLLATVLLLELATGINGEDITTLYPYALAQRVNSLSPLSGERFGNPAISGDGTTAVIGNPQYESAGYEPGYAIVYQRASKGQWKIHQVLNGTDKIGPYSQEGTSVSISEKGSVIVTGGVYDAPNTQYNGAAWIYARSGTKYVQSGVKRICTETGESFGAASAISKDETTIVITSWSSSCPGQVFTKENGNWISQGLLSANATISDAYGFSAAISGNGDTILIGSYYSGGYVAVYVRTTGFWICTQLFTLGGGIGTSLSMVSDASAFVASGENIVAYFTLTSNGYVQGPSIPAPPNTVEFGYGNYNSAQLFQGGLKLLVGDPKANFFNGTQYGAIFLFQFQNGIYELAPGNLSSLFLNLDPEQPSRTNFGYSLAVSYDGTSLVVGAVLVDSHDGAGFFFTQEKEECAPSPSLSRGACEKLVRKCKTRGSPMKWSKRGCRVRGVPQGDGGCQCLNYCGYQCPSACNADHACTWSNSQGVCVFKSTLKPGLPTPFC